MTYLSGSVNNTQYIQTYVEESAGPLAPLRHKSIYVENVETPEPAESRLQPGLANAAYFFHEPAPPWTDSVGIHHCLEFTLRPYGGRNRGLGRCPGSILTWVKRFRMCWLKYLPLDSAFSNS